MDTLLNRPLQSGSYFTIEITVTKSRMNDAVVTGCGIGVDGE